MRLNNLYKWLVFVGLETLTLDGWPTRGSSSFAPTIGLTHWIAGRRNAAAGTRPALALIRDGHSTLPGPLAQVYHGRAGEVVCVAAGRANHAGYGYWKGVTGNTGSYGIEAEAADGRDWTAAQKRSYPLIHVAFLFAMWEKGLISWSQITSNRVAGHSEFALPPGRKVDVNGYTMNQLRAEVAALIPGFKKRVNGKAIAVGTNPIYNIATGKFTDGNTPSKGTWFEDMATKKDLQDAVRTEIDRTLNRTPSGPEGSRERRFQYHDMRSQLLYAADGGLKTTTILGRLEAIETSLTKGAKLDETLIAEKVAASLLPDLQDEIATAIEASPDRDAADTAKAVVDQLANRLQN